MNRFYLDTSIWLDLYEKRGENGKIVREMIKNFILENREVIYSNIIIKELRVLNYQDLEIKEILGIDDIRIRWINTNKIQTEEAKRLVKHFNIPLADALHSILARDNECILVSRDKHFEKLRFLITVQKSEELI
jgi:predicted nucleic acid-binding protein